MLALDLLLTVLIAVPWIFATLLFARAWHAKAAREILGVDNETSDTIALECVAASMVGCTPIAFLVGWWCGVHILVYGILAVGVQYKVARSKCPLLDTSVVWRWSWKVNLQTVVLSFLIWIVAMGILVVKQDRPADVDSRLGPGYPFDSQILESMLNRRKLENNWHQVPAWLAGRWRISRMINVTRSDNNRWKEYVQDAPEISSYGQFSDKTGQVWECEQVGEESRYESSPDSLYQGHTYKLEQSQSKATNSEYGFRVRLAHFDLWNGGKEIAGAAQQVNDVSIHLAAPGLATTKMIARVSDWHGGPIFTKESEYSSAKVGPLIINKELKKPDGAPLYPAFMQYLKAHGLAERIP